ncbi:MAG: hypothetical protein V3W41_17335 [Planctomycetota bacterium]
MNLSLRLSPAAGSVLVPSPESGAHFEPLAQLFRLAKWQALLEQVDGAAQETGADDSEGLVEVFHCEGVLAAKGEKLEGQLDGIWKEWRADGSPVLEGSFSKGVRCGRWTWWYANGQKAREGDFASGRPVGTWLSWQEDGSEAQRRDYLD